MEEDNEQLSKCVSIFKGCTGVQVVQFTTQGACRGTPGVERSCTKGDVWGRCGGANFEGSHSSETQLGNLDREQRRGKSIVIIFTYELFGMFATSKCDPSQGTLW